MLHIINLRVFIFKILRLEQLAGWSSIQMIITDSAPNMCT